MVAYRQSELDEERSSHRIPRRPWEACTVVGNEPDTRVSEMSPVSSISLLLSVSEQFAGGIFH